MTAGLPLFPETPQPAAGRANLAKERAIYREWRNHPHVVEQRGTSANDRRRIVAATIIALAIVAVAGVATWLGQASIAIPLGLAGLLGTVFRRLMARRPGPE